MGVPGGGARGDPAARAGALHDEPRRARRTARPPPVAGRGRALLPRRGRRGPQRGIGEPGLRRVAVPRRRAGLADQPAAGHPSGAHVATPSGAGRRRRGHGLPGPADVESPARIALDNLRPSRARSSVPRTLRPEELEERLDRLARQRGDAALNVLRDEARSIAAELDAAAQFAQLDALIGALLGTRDAALSTPAARARRAGFGYDADRLAMFETLRAELAVEPLPARPAPADPRRLLAFFEAYFSNWIEGTVFEVGEAEDIVFGGHVPPQRPADAHDVSGTFEAIADARLGAQPPHTPDELEDYLRAAHARVMAGRPEAAPGAYKARANRAGMTVFVHPDLVRGTLREGFALLDTLADGLARATFAMFLVAEVHPFADGNGRVARLLMNAELSARAVPRDGPALLPRRVPRGAPGHESQRQPEAAVAHGGPRPAVRCIRGLDGSRSGHGADGRHERPRHPRSSGGGQRASARR